MLEEVRDLQQDPHAGAFPWLIHMSACLPGLPCQATGPSTSFPGQSWLRPSLAQFVFFKRLHVLLRASC